MSKRNYICFECRTTKRATAAYGLNNNYRCSQCQGKLCELPWQWRIPKKTNKTEWEKLRKTFTELENKWLPLRVAEGQAQLNKIDAQINTISQQKTAKDKEDKIKYLQWKRQEIKTKYTE